MGTLEGCGCELLSDVGSLDEDEVEVDAEGVDDDDDVDDVAYLLFLSPLVTPSSPPPLAAAPCSAWIHRLQLERVLMEAELTVTVRHAGNKKCDIGFPMTVVKLAGIE